MPTRRTSPRRTALRPSASFDNAEDDEPSGSRLAALAPWLAIVALLAGLTALAVIFLGRGPDLAACRSSAWSSIPDKHDLPQGWTLGSTDLNASGMTVTIFGQASTDGTSSQPAVVSSVTCYGDAAVAAMNSHRTAAEAAGSTVRNRKGATDAYDVDNPTTQSVTTLFRVGGLIAQVADFGTVDPTDRAVIISAVAAAMGDGTAAGTGAPRASEVAVASDEPTESFDAGPSPSSVAPDLEAKLPTSIAGTPLTIDSFTAEYGFGTDPASRALSAALRTLGIDLTKLQVAQAYDETQSIDFGAYGFRLPGGDMTKIETTIEQVWLSSGTAGVKQSKVSLGGRTFTKIDYGGLAAYVFRGADYVIVMQTSDPSLATEAAGQVK
jgi:hypothetical protein